MFNRFRVWLAGLLLPKNYRISEATSDLVGKSISLDLQVKEMREIWKNVIDEQEKNGRKRNVNEPTRLAFRVDPNEVKIAEGEAEQVLAEMRSVALKLALMRTREREEARLRSDCCATENENT